MYVMRYDDAVASLYQVPIDQFVAERKRLAGELKAAGDKDGAARLAKLARPPISAWVVDQLWWQARDAFDALFETAQRLRDGKLDAMAAHRDAIAKLRAQASKILTGAEHTVTEATLRRVTQTLSALAASGGWEPDSPGALSADREPPGFEAIGVSNDVPLAVLADAGGAGKAEVRRARDHGKTHEDAARACCARRDTCFASSAITGSETSLLTPIASNPGGSRSADSAPGGSGSQPPAAASADSVCVTRRRVASFAACSALVKIFAASARSFAIASRCAAIASRWPSRSRRAVSNSASNASRACHHS